MKMNQQLLIYIPCISNTEVFLISLTLKGINVGISYLPNWYCQYLCQPSISVSVHPYTTALAATHFKNTKTMNKRIGNV